MLVDPRTDEIRYVGKTNQKLSARITAHMRDKTKCHRTRWLMSLAKQGLRPIGVELERIEREPSEASTGWTWQSAEVRWIAKLKKMGARLVNGTAGGDGVVNLPPDVRARITAAWVGRKHTPETIQKLIAARKKRGGHSAETRAKMSKSQKGRKITWGEALAESNRKLTAEQVSEIKRRLDAGEMVKYLAQELSMHRTSISKIKAGTYFDRYRK